MEGEEDVKKDELQEKPQTVDIKYFECSLCGLKEKFDYFGDCPPYIKRYNLKEDAYVIEDPFLPPKQGQLLILGAHCVKCNNCVCKDVNCSFYYDGTYCIKCAKNNITNFPEPVQEKLNRIVSH